MMTIKEKQTNQSFLTSPIPKGTVWWSRPRGGVLCPAKHRCHKAKDTDANTHANVSKPHRPDQMCHERGQLSEDPLRSNLWNCVHNVCSPCFILKKSVLNVLKRFLFSPHPHFLSMFYPCRFPSTCSVNVPWCCIPDCFVVMQLLYLCRCWSSQGCDAKMHTHEILQS